VPHPGDTGRMKAISRRAFATLMGLGTASVLVPPGVLGQATPRVVVIGGGAGGATAARHLARDGGGAIEVTLVQDSPRYTSCFFSNLHVGEVRDFDSITHDYDALAAEDGLTLVIDRAVGIDRVARTVALAGGDVLPYDRLVLSPGIDLIHESVPGYSESAAERAPHAWQGGAQTARLKSALDALENGRNIVMVAPPNPYRCPPGPYERASMMAHVLTSRGFTDSTITILDTKSAFSKQALFSAGWRTHYPGMIEWLPPDVHGGILEVDAAAGTVETDLDTFEGALLNIIPAQRAGAIAVDAGLADDSGFCPVVATSMRSTLDENIFVIGDASIAGAMPKSAYAANSQAKVAARNVRVDLLGARDMAATYANICWSLISPDNGVKVGAQYRPGEDGTITSVSSFLSEADESDATRAATYRESVGWYDAIIADMLG